MKTKRRIWFFIFYFIVLTATFFYGYGFGKDASGYGWFLLPMIISGAFVGWFKE